MDYQRFVDSVNAPCAVLSVTRAKDGGCGEILVVSRNDAMSALMREKFLPGAPYSDDGMRNMRFEEFCFRAALRGQNIHDYTFLNALSGWGEVILIPLCRESDEKGYCQFMLEPSKPEEAAHMAKVSPAVGAAIIKTCISLMGTQDFLSSVEDVLQDILDISGAWCCRIILTDDDRKTVVNYCECVRPELPSEDRLEIIRSWEETVGVARTVITTSEAELQVLSKHNPVWADYIRSRGLKTFLLVPLHRDQTTIGFLYMLNFDAEKVVEIKEIAELTGFFLGTQITNRLLVDRLEEMSYTDGLTGLNNRHSMLRRMRSLQADWSKGQFGVVNLDLNGLKVVNDTEGHAAGDQLLIRASEILTKVFYREDVYRTGGDEFIVIATGIDEETFRRKLDRLHAAVEKDEKVRFACGACWSDGSIDVKGTFNRADERMYDDKKEFYSAHPELRRK